MRFDYQPPITFNNTPRYRRLATLYLTILGIGCICYAVISDNTAHYQQKDSGPRFFARKQSSPTLSLAPEVAEPADPLVSAAAQLPSPTEYWRSATVKSGDTLGKIFSNMGIPYELLNQMLSDNSVKKMLTKLHPGQILDFKFDENQQLKELKMKLSELKTLYITQTVEGFKHYFEEQTPITKLKYISAKIEDSLYGAAQSVGLDDSMTMEMAEILGWDIDFSSDIRANDSFKVLMEESFIEDVKINTGKILAVEFSNNGKVHRAIRYVDQKGQEGYYTPEGQSLQKAFIRNPVKYTRISSHFSTTRRHPVLHKMRAHKGTDYAAPQGTPIKASGDGRISFIGTKGGYGKSIEISHGQKYSTFYAHMSRFNSKLKQGSYVKQGQVIGYVGQTGLATGPHLHYEFRINGVHHNPITVPLPRATPIAKTEKNDFSKHANNLLDSLDSQSVIVKND